MATPTPSSLISQIHSLFPSPNHLDRGSAIKLKIGLQNLLVILVCLRNLGDDDFSHVMHSLFERIRDALRRIPTPKHVRYFSVEGQLYDSQLSDALREVNCLAEEVVVEWYTSTTSNSLTLDLDDAVEIADSILQCTLDFRYWREISFRAADKFDVQTRFFRDFLAFAKAKQSGADKQLLKSLLIYNRPPADVVDVAGGFWIDGLFSLGVAGWAIGVQSTGPDVNPRVFQIYTQILLSISTLHHTQDDYDVLVDFLSSLISIFWYLLINNSHNPHLDSLKALYEALRLSRSILKQHGYIAYQIGGLICDAGVVICSFGHTADVDPSSVSHLLQRFDATLALVPPESNSSKANPLDLGGSTTTSIEDDGESQFETVVASPPSKTAGFQEDEVTSVEDRLMRGSKQLRLVPISGMAGLGKTTFALQVYNHPSIMCYFHVRAWCPISQVFDKKRVLVHLLNQICPADYSEMSEHDVADKLRKSLKGMRYLILLDDVWYPEVLESLRPSFPDDRMQSRIILTSRLHGIVPRPLHDEQPHFLRPRTDNECLKIIKMKLLHKAIGWGTELENFARLCKGLPLIAVLVAGLLETTVQQGWEGIMSHLTSGGVSSAEQCNIALELSYEHLPNELKPCFIYFGVFPEDEEISAKKLIMLWMAEGFVAKESDLLKKRAEDVAREYLDSLIQRNLIMVVEKTSMGGTKVCRIHDLLHDFCLMKGKKENLFHLLRQMRDELMNFTEPSNLKRLSIQSNAPHFVESRLFCPLAQSILFFNGGKYLFYFYDMLFIIQIYESIKVLDMGRFLLLKKVPSEIALLTQLTYLSIECVENVIPSSIGELSNLETLIIIGPQLGVISMPCTLWNLQKLKILHISRDGFFGFSLPIENFENSSRMLLSLDVICGIGFCSNRSMEEQLRKFPNIHRLKCYIQHGGESLEEPNKMIVVPAFLSQLESLSMRGEGRLRYQFDFGCAESLRKVTLSNFVLSREEVEVIGKLPNLEVLKLLQVEFLEGTMEMEEGEFSKLRILILGARSDFSKGINIKMWTVSGDEQLPRLEKLVFHRCDELEEIPDCLETSSTLEEIVVSYCSPALESCVRHIEEVQQDYIKVRYKSEEKEVKEK